MQKINKQALDSISWNEYFMAIAKVNSLRSKDPSTKVGCAIVDKNNRILSMGYNGTPNDFPDDEFPWDRKAENELDTKYPYVCHAELNAIANFIGDRHLLREGGSDYTLRSFLVMNVQS